MPPTNFLSRAACLSAILISLSCMREGRPSRFGMNAYAKVFNDSLLVCRTLDDSITVRDIRSGKMIFSKKVSGGELLPADPVLDSQNNLYAVFTGEALSCINIAGNVTKWTYRGNDKINFISPVGDRVIISTRVFGIFGLHAATGKVLYRLADSTSSTCPSTLRITFVNDGKRFYVPDFQCNTIAAFTIADGKKLWRYSNEDFGPAQAMISRDLLFCGMTNDVDKGSLFLLDKLTGKLVFQDPANAPDLITNPVAYGDKVIFLTNDSRLMLFDPLAKSSKLLHQFAQGEAGCGTRVYLLNDNLFLGDCNFNLMKFNLKTKTLTKPGKMSKALNEVYRSGNTQHFVY